jgi:NAD(P) transhydrogenase
MRVTMRLGEEVESVEEPSPGTVVANLESKKKVSGDALLYAVGRQGNVDDLNLAAAGLEADKRGRIAVDEHYQTKVGHIYAAGDVVGFPSLASVSMEQGSDRGGARVQRHAASSNPSFYPVRHLHHSRDQLHRQDRGAVDGRRRAVRGGHGLLPRGGARADSRRHHGRLKLIFHRDTRKVLGVHIIGEDASELVHIGQAVMTLDGTVDYFIDTVFNYPTLAECYKVAAFNGLGRLHKYQTE